MDSGNTSTTPTTQEHTHEGEHQAHHAPHHPHHHHSHKAAEHQHPHPQALRIEDILQQDPGYVDYPTIATGAEALQRLKEGNKIWSDGNLVHYIQHLVHKIKVEGRVDHIKGQKPYVVILTCSDSRVGPELIFNEGVGHVFVVRIAGNVADKLAIGSIEYAVEHLKVPLFVVMGHQKCGAVKATLDTIIAESGQQEPGHHHEDNGITAIIEAVKPAVNTIKSQIDFGKEYDKAFDAAIAENAKASMRTIINSSAILKNSIENKHLTAVAAVYHIHSGTVEFFE